jgi:hypothetical protein
MDTPATNAPRYAPPDASPDQSVGLTLTGPRLVERYAEIPFTINYTVPLEWHSSAFKSAVPDALIGVAVNQLTGQSDATHFRRDYRMNPVKFDSNPVFPEPSGTGFVSGSVKVNAARFLRLLQTPGPYWSFVVLGPLVSNVIAFTVKDE